MYLPNTFVYSVTQYTRIKVFKTKLNFVAQNNFKGTYL